MNWFNKIVRLAEKKLMYHGTSMERGMGILSQGFIPNPPDKTYPDGEPLASFPGSYFAENIREAMSFFSGISNILFELQIETKTSVPDEDTMPRIKDAFNMVHYQFIESMRKNNQGDDFNLIEYIIANQNQIDRISEIVASEYIKLMVSEKPSSGAKAIPEDQRLVLLQRVYQSMDYVHDFIREVCKDIISPEHQKMFGTEVASSYHYYAKCRSSYDKMMRSLPSLGKYTSKVRVPEPISFSGSNRILCAVQVDSLPSRGYVFYVRYGSPSAQLSAFIDSYEKS